MTTFESIVALCENKAELSESDLISQLKAVQIDPDVLAARDEVGSTLLHIAACNRSPEFCQVLHELNATLVKSEDIWNGLPIHSACRELNVETAKYLFNVYPKGIIDFPLHYLVESHNFNENGAVELLSFLLKYDKSALSTPNSAGELPLHLACQKTEFPIVKLLFDEYPDGIFVQDYRGNTPLEIAIARFWNLARSYNESVDQAEVIPYLHAQLEFHRQALEDQEPDRNKQLPIHRVMQSSLASIGTIQLVVEANRASVTAADIQGCVPLHLACQFGDLDIVKYLVEQDENSLTIVNSMGNLPLHHACLGGKADIVTYILKTTDHGVSVENNQGRFPIQLFLFDAACDRDLQHVDAFDSLLRADPIGLLAILSPGFFVDEK